MRSQLRADTLTTSLNFDANRIDKFYLLLRRFVNAAFRLLASEDWNQAAVARFAALTIKAGGPLW